MTTRIPLRLTYRRPITASVLHLGFEHADGAPLPFRAGQFIQLHVVDANGTLQRRSYSLAGAPLEEGRRWEILVGLAPGGLASARLAQMAMGETVEATGPFGRFGLAARDVAPRYLMIATGTGIAPFRSMLPDLVQRAESGANVVLLHGVRDSAQLYFRKDFLDAAGAVPGFTYLGCLSREAVPGGDPHLLGGRVQQALDALSPRADDIACLCGHPEMVDEVALRLREAGLAPPAIRRERFTASG
ncbi:MAG: FAD-binding oxidoreductase [Xanthomonadaceae bacterium]|nr:FAD-binding oxidoreductase [Xanthomonadaceae bacterium]